MLFASVIWFALFGISQASGGRLIPRTITIGPNATSTSAGLGASTSSLTCCYLSDFNVQKIIWFTGSVEIVVATVSTIVYQYDNTAITSYQTIKANSTTTFPSDYWDNGDDYTIPGVPTDIIGTNLGPYLARTTVMYGTAWTDPYGVVYQSPTPVWDFGYVSYASFYPTPLPDGGYACPSAGMFMDGGDVNDDMMPYPSGCFLADDDPAYGQNNTGELITMLPAGLRDCMVSHVPPNTSTYWSELAGCTMGGGDGVPIAHIPVTELTASRSITSTLTGDYGKPTAIPETSPPAPPDVPVSTPETSPSVSSPKIPPTPPSDTPPVDTPPVETPPVETPPVETPGNGDGNNPPTITPPADTPPEATPSTPPQNPPANTPSVITPSTTPPGSGDNPAAPPPTTVFTAGGSTFTVNPSTGVVIGGSTLTLGGTVIVPGDSGSTTFILPSTGSSIIVNGATQTLNTLSGTTRFIIIDGTTFLPNSASGFVIGGQTLTPGGVITQSGETISLATGGSSIILAEGSETKTQGLGNIIASQGGFATSKPPGYDGPLASKGGVVGLDVRTMGCLLGMGIMFIWAL